MTMPQPPTTFYEDTIAAIVTGIGGAVTIIRISGSEAFSIANSVWRGKRRLDNASARQISLGACYAADGQLIDAEVLAFSMPNPHSYTGEDVVELQCHGGSLVGKMILNALLEHADCRAAEPGEFTKRAYLNGRIDLTQAEAVADIISAQSQAAIHLAGKQLKGYLGKEITAFYHRLVEILTEIESRMDFPDEELDWMSQDHIEQIFGAAQEHIQQLLRSRHDGEIYKNGLQLVIAGAPNVGKSSLMNAILGKDRAIVTHIAGTTRDVIAEMVQLRGIPICLTDTAGLRETSDIVEQSGIERSRESIRSASVLLWVYDVSAQDQAIFPDRSTHDMPIILIGNKIDSVSREDYPVLPQELTTLPHVYISAKEGQGFQELLDIIEEMVWHGHHKEEPEYAVNARHAALLESASQVLQDAQFCIMNQDYELGAVSLRAALSDIGSIIGITAEHDVLDTIFSKFCIGK